MERTASRDLGTLSSQINAGKLLKRGAKGTSVRELQQALNNAGANLAVDGDFGPATRKALQSFQRSNELSPDGIAGPKTLRALQQSANVGGTTLRQPRTIDRTYQPQPPSTGTTTGPSGVTPGPVPDLGTPSTAFAKAPGRVSGSFASTQGAREQQAEDILRANGAWPPEEGRAYAIQIDQDPPPASASRADRQSHLRSYSGETSVFRVENGQLREVTGPLRSASHPGQSSTSFRGTPDVNRDGRSDIAHIRPGVYRYNTNTNYRGRFNPVTNEEFRNAARDTNQDGTIDGAEADRGYAATAIQIHAGGTRGPSSVGCQTLPPGDYERFTRGVREANTGGGGEFTYVLVRRDNDQFGANPY